MIASSIDPHENEPTGAKIIGEMIALPICLSIPSKESNMSNAAIADYVDSELGPIQSNGENTRFALEEPIQLKGFSATYDRKFNLGNFESLNPAITVWVKTNVPEGASFDLHDCKNRLRQMARDNVRAQLQRLQGNKEVVFLGLRPPANGSEDPIFVRTVSVSLVYKVNLGDYHSITPGYTDWADVRNVAGSPGELHLALTRMWTSLWANVEEEIARARGHGVGGAFLGLPQIAVEDLTTTPAAARASGRANGSRAG